MSIDPYATHTQAIKDALITRIKTATSFATHTYADYIRKITSYPTAFVRLRRDTVSDIGPKETRHILTFVIQITYRGTYTESTLNSIIGYVGEIVDVIEASRTLGSSHVLNTEVVDIDYSMKEDEQAIFHYAHLTVEVEALRNV
jgi:hypothetical protein